METLVSNNLNLGIAACRPTRVVFQTLQHHRHLCVEGEKSLVVARRLHPWSSHFTLGPAARYAFRTANDRNYIQAEGGGGGEVTAAARRITAWSELTLIWVDRKQRLFALRASATDRELYLEAVNGGGGPVMATQTSIVPSALFTLVPRRGGHCAVCTSDGEHYLRAVDGGGGQLLADSSHIGTEEMFHLMTVPTVEVALRTPDGFYLSGQGGLSSPIIPGAQKVGEAELFRLVPLGEEAVGIRCAGYLFAQVHEDGRLWATGESPMTPDQRFFLEPVEPDRIALRAEANDKYVDARGRSVIASAPTLEQATLFSVVPQPEVKVDLLGPDGLYYVSAEMGGGGQLFANAQNVETWETFVLTPVPGTTDEYRLRTAAGHYVCAEASGKVSATSLIPTVGCNFRIEMD